MRKDDYDKLLADFMAAEKDYLTYRASFFASTGGGALGKAVTRESLDRLAALRETARRLEDRWFEVVRSTEPIEP